MKAILCMPALEYLKELPHLPMTMHGNDPRRASNSQLKRWLESGSVVINGCKPKPQDLVELPVVSLVFFPKSKKRKTTML